MYILFTLTFYPYRLPDPTTRGQRRPPQAHDSQRRPTQAPDSHAGQRWPTDLRQPTQATQANDGQRRPTKANVGPRQPTKANECQRRSTTATQANLRFFVLFFFYFIYTNKIHDILVLPTKVNAGQRQSLGPTNNQCRPTAANNGCYPYAPKHTRKRVYE